MSTATMNSVACPKCSGPMWDEQKGKFWGTGLTTNGKQKPIFKCRDKSCDGVIWPPKNGTPPAAKPAYQPPPTPSLPNETGAEPYFQQETGGPPVGSGGVAEYAAMLARYEECVMGASRAWAKVPASVDLAAAAATLFIQREKAGI